MDGSGGGFRGGDAGIFTELVDLALGGLGGVHGVLQFGAGGDRGKKVLGLGSRVLRLFAGALRLGTGGWRPFAGILRFGPLARVERGARAAADRGQKTGAGAWAGGGSNWAMRLSSSRMVLESCGGTSSKGFFLEADQRECFAHRGQAPDGLGGDADLLDGGARVWRRASAEGWSRCGCRLRRRRRSQVWAARWGSGEDAGSLRR